GMTTPHATGGPFRFLSPNPCKDCAHVPSHLGGKRPHPQHPQLRAHQPPHRRHPHPPRPVLGHPGHAHCSALLVRRELVHHHHRQRRSKLVEPARSPRHLEHAESHRQRADHRAAP